MCPKIHTLMNAPTTAMIMTIIVAGVKYSVRLRKFRELIPIPAISMVRSARRAKFIEYTQLLWKECCTLNDYPEDDCPCEARNDIQDWYAPENIFEKKQREGHEQPRAESLIASTCAGTFLLVQILLCPAPQYLAVYIKSRNEFRYSPEESCEDDCKNVTRADTTIDMYLSSAVAERETRSTGTNAPKTRAF